MGFEFREAFFAGAADVPAEGIETADKRAVLVDSAAFCVEEDTCAVFGPVEQSPSGSSMVRYKVSGGHA